MAVKKQRLMCVCKHLREDHFHVYGKLSCTVYFRGECCHCNDFKLATKVNRGIRGKKEGRKG